MKRFTLSTLLLFAALIALSTALFTTSSQLSKARTELVKLRNEMRLLEPSKPDQMRAIQIPAFGRNQWRWRVDLPDEEKFVLRWAYNEIPLTRASLWRRTCPFGPPNFQVTSSFFPLLPYKRMASGCLEYPPNPLPEEARSISRFR